MSVVTMDMTSYEVRPEDSRQQDFGSNDYSDEILCSGWIPTLSLELAPSFENSAAIPEDLVCVDAERFLRKMYVWQR